jgi:hypothetical protein
LPDRETIEEGFMSYANIVRNSVVVSLVGALLVGCGSEPAESEYAFGETDMQNAIVGAWTGTMSLTGQMATPYTLSIVQVPALQPACGNRTFNAPQCVETSSMSVEGTLTTADKVFDGVKLQGNFMVIGLEMTYGDLSLSGSGVTMSGGLEMAKSVHDLTISGSQTGSATMQR